MKGNFMMSHNSIGLFTQIAPLAEKYYHISPYAYCAANPVKYLDPDGKEIWSMTCEVDDNTAN